MSHIHTFLMFDGQAEAAMNFYVSLFQDSEIISMQRYGKDGLGKEGSIISAVFKMNGQIYMCVDSATAHDFSFTPAISFFVSCEEPTEIEELYLLLATGGKVLMELGSYGFSEKFAWVQDKFGVSWQLNFG